MKVLAINARTVMISAVVSVMVIVSAVIIIFGRDDNFKQETPEVEIVLPEGVTE